ncbi:ABC transporter ATP-binding protein [Jannaschia rubra]|uniref:Putative multidrug export ATP-binding/permease protein n=1 Tax=Jannaschia rubra TaxID=282197 RepID=A0A0M6XP39_9RHOB|nr:ABC transporter ATP-binding protein [Jannaschia rubra]CTQ31885.1 Putative multidrug export ATP-binding/permease protein [Jannaschia rubra]SFG78043.1 ATP-binding cassette, subfamily B [Jannaschia rubra]
MSKHRKDKLTEVMPSLRHVMTRLAPYLRGHRAVLGGSVVALLAATAMKLLEPWPLKFVIDRVVPTVAGEGATVASLPPMTLLALCSVGLVAIVGFKALFQYLSTVGFALVGTRVLTAVRTDLFRHLQTLSLGFHARSRTGDLTMRLVSDVGMLKETAVTAALPLAANLLVLGGMLTVMLFLDWRLALLALSPLPLLWLVSLRLTRRIRDVSRAQRKREGELASTGAETMAGIRTIQALGLEDRASDDFGAASARDLRAGVKGKRLAAGLERSVDLLTGLGLAIVLFFGARQVMAGQITPGDLLVFFTYLKNTFRPVREYAKYTARLAKAAAAGERVVALLDEVPEVRDARGAVAAPQLDGRVTFEDVTFGYGPGAPTLNGLSVDVASGEMVAITGPSGAGKSTFASLIPRLYDPARGRVLIDGHDLRSLTLASLRANIALVPQETLIFRGTLAENIALGAGREVTPEEIEAAARLANAHGFIAAQPDGYDTVIAERGATLSAGQRQRIAIARAALRRAPVLILDEPTVGLDRTSEAAVTEAIWRLAEGRTTFLVTHDLTMAARAGRILHLDGGRIAEDGSHAALMAAGGRYAAMWAGGEDARRAVAG